MAGIQLSQQLFDDIQQAVLRQEPEAEKDQGLVMQYLAALIGYQLGNQDLPREHKDAFLEELTGFVRHVYEDTQARTEERQRSQASQAFGYWVPSK
ncbi:MAG: hypothetical protein ABFS23_00795 [Pseudomonadota bacterium]